MTNALAHIRATVERNAAEYRFLARLSGHTIAEVEADVTASDPIGGGRESVMAHHFRLRVDDTNPRHVHFSVFANGALCGKLCMTPDEYSKFAITLLVGADHHPEVEARAETATGNPSIGEKM